MAGDMAFGKWDKTMNHLWLFATVSLFGINAAHAQSCTSGSGSSPTQLGAYVGEFDTGNSANQATTVNQLNSFTNSMGQAPTQLVTYVDSTQPESQWISDAQWEAKSWPKGTTPDIGIPMASSANGESADQSFKNIASGSEDAIFNGIFQAYASKGISSFDIRPGWEMSGNWYPWAVTPENAADYVAAFQHIAALAHSFSGAKISVVWNPAAGGTSASLASMYPGNDAADIIGLDIYGAPINYDASPNDTSTSTSDITLTDVLNLAKQQGKPFALPETGGVNASFPQALADVVSKSGVPVAFANLWDINDGSGNLSWSNPGENSATAAAWKAAFAKISGNGNCASSTPQAASTPVATADTVAPATSTAAATPICTAATPNYDASNGGFGTPNGQIISPNGKPFVARGINIRSTELGDVLNGKVTAAFPGINFVRINVRNLDSPESLKPAIDYLTAKGIVVDLEDHPDGGGAQDAWASQPGDVAWYGQVAAAFKSNPYVWFGSFNEPSSDNLTAWQQATYSAIRDAGNNNPILMEVSGSRPNNLDTALATNVYSNMTNVIADVHAYNYQSNDSTDQNTVNANVNDMIGATQGLKSADGTMPVIIGEYGNSTDGSSPDAGGTQEINAVINSGVGSAAWSWVSGGSDALRNSDGSLSAYGQQVAAFTSGSGTQGCAESPVATPDLTQNTAVQQPQTATAQPAASVTSSVTPGRGSIADAQGNAWTITSSGSIQMGTTWVPGGGGTAALKIVNGTVYGLDNSGKGWFTFNGTYWTPSADPETAPPLAATTAQTAPALLPASTSQTAPPLQ